jgi:probable F420-dependent oxidoreductase
LRVGTLVLQNDLRHPVMLAKEWATLDLLSGGRAELGIGAGGSWPPDFATSGIPFDPPKTRVARLEECLPVLRQCFAEGPFDFDGQYYQLARHESWPKPVQSPLPILIAGAGPRMLKLAAEQAEIVAILPRLVPTGDGFHENDVSDAVFAAKAARVRQWAGARADAIEFNVLIQVLDVTNDRAGAIARLKAEHGFDDDLIASPMCLIGSVAEIVERIHQIRETTGMSYFVVRGDIDPFVPVIKELAGR